MAVDTRRVTRNIVDAAIIRRRSRSGVRSAGSAPLHHFPNTLDDLRVG